VNLDSEDDLSEYLEDSSSERPNEGSAKSIEGAFDRFEESIRQGTGAQFRQWLISGNGIFHIEGKSTFMKFLCRNQVTRRALRTWAGDKTLVFVRFLFLNPSGDSRRETRDIKSSFYGAQRSLLYQVLKKCPELCQLVLPRHWKKLLKDEIVEDILKEDIKAAFSLLLNSREIFTSRRICFFIDGLDELEDPDFGFKDLAVKLKKWIQKSNDSIKICVSSRELKAFQVSFRDERRLRLRDVTNKDIKAYVRGRLTDELTASTELSLVKIGSLVSHITERSEGVFLWVKGVIEAVKAGIDRCDEMQALEAMVDLLPSI
jgi:hypothetical protein